MSDLILKQKRLDSLRRDFLHETNPLEKRRIEEEGKKLRAEIEAEFPKLSSDQNIARRQVRAREIAEEMRQKRRKTA